MLHFPACPASPAPSSPTSPTTSPSGAIAARTVFFTDDDRRTYLAWLKDYCAEHAVEILAYCLMTNHIHLIAVPSTDDGWSRC